MVYITYLKVKQKKAKFSPKFVIFYQNLIVTCSLKFVIIFIIICQSVQSLSHVWLFVTLRTVACLASLSMTNSQSLLKVMSIELVMPSNHLILCCPFSFCLQSFPASGSFPTSWPFTSGGQSIGASASASVLPMNIQGQNVVHWRREWQITSVFLPWELHKQ